MQQQASAEILRAVAGSSGDAERSLQEVAEITARLFRASSVRISVLKDGEGSTYHAGRRLEAVGTMPADARARVEASNLSSAVVTENRQIHIPDLDDIPPEMADWPGLPPARAAGARTVAGTPLRRDGKAIGVLLIHRDQPFSEAELALQQDFADQAAMAIENARLFRETRDALERQKATSDILNVIAGSPTDTRPVFEAIAIRAKSLVGGFSSTVFRFVDGQAHLEAFTPTTPAADQFLQSTFPRKVDDFAPFRMAQSGEVTQIPDTEDLTDEIKHISRARGFRSMLYAPLMNKTVSIGFIAVTRVEPGSFDQHHVQLLKTFADQAVIAIGNTQLFDEVQARTRELARSLEDLRAAQDRLVQTEKLASLGQLTAGIAHEIKNPLNFVNNFAALSAELTDELDETLVPAPLDAKLRGDVGELTQMIRSNLAKVVQHGKRADSIVRSMLLHSREGSGERRASDVNALVSESLNLAYHGARAERSDFNITLRQDLDPDVGVLEVFPQEITRALLNLISNGFHAATRRTAEAGGGTFEPVLSATTRNTGDAVEIRIRDNGTGIPPEIRQKIFNPFFTTKATGEGTGLGLSMTHDIIVKQHGGRIDVETEPGMFTEFIVTLPRNSDAGPARQ